MTMFTNLTMLVAALGCGAVAGVFFAFSSFVMPALRQVDPKQGIVAMQSINVSAITPAFMSLLFGTAAACVVLLGLELAGSGGERSGLAIGASVLYILGTIGVTIVRNVPLNNELAALDPESQSVVPFWATYVSKWTAWNHLRALSALLAAGMFMIALNS
jgi:uncharacterized membrane protein